MSMYRRTIITLDDTQKNIDYMLFCVFEKLWPDMVSPKPLHSHPKYKNFNNDNRFDVCVHVDEIDITTDVSNDPFPYVELLGKKVDILWGEMRRDPDLGINGFALKKGHKDIDSLTDVLPQADSVQEVWSWFDTKRKMSRFLAEHNINLGKIGKYTQKNLGFDISLHSLQIGCLYVIHYQPIRTVHIETVPSMPAVRCEIRWRDMSLSEDVIVIVTENVVDKQSIPHVFTEPVAKDNSFALVQMSSRPRRINVEIVNNKGVKLYFLNNVTFIGSVTQKLSSHQRTKVTPVTTTSIIVGLEHYLKPAILEKERRLQRERMEFMFFDGDPLKMAENKKNASDAVIRMLGKATHRIIIADPYFSVKQFDEYVKGMNGDDNKLEIYIINCKDQLKEVAHGRKVKVKVVVDELIQAINEFNAKGKSLVSCYGISGKGRLHDRFILTEKEGWLIGSSLSEFGNRACSIVKLTESGWDLLMDLTSEWRSDKKVSLPIEEIVWTEKKKSSIMSFLKCFRKSLCDCIQKTR